MQELFRQIIHLEKKLHHQEHRKNRLFLSAVIHDDFFQFERSGLREDKEEMLQDLLSTAFPFTAMTYSENHQAILLKPGVILVTYQSYQLDHGQKTLLTNRSSIWIETRSTDWQLRFHQETPVMIESNNNERNRS